MGDMILAVNKDTLLGSSYDAVSTNLQFICKISFFMSNCYFKSV